MKKFIITLSLAVLLVFPCIHAISEEKPTFSDILAIQDLLCFFHSDVTIQDVKDGFGEPTNDLDDWIIYADTNGTAWDMTCKFTESVIREVTFKLEYANDHTEVYNSYMALMMELIEYCGEKPVQETYEYKMESVASENFIGALSAWIGNNDGYITLSAHVDTPTSGMVIFLTYTDFPAESVEDNSEFVIPKGEYVVGTHIPAGEYSLEYVDEPAIIRIKSSEQFFGDSYSLTDHEDVVGRVVLNDGQQVEISHGSIRFIPFSIDQLKQGK